MKLRVGNVTLLLAGKAKLGDGVNVIEPITVHVGRCFDTAEHLGHLSQVVDRLSRLVGGFVLIGHCCRTLGVSHASPSVSDQ